MNDLHQSSAWIAVFSFSITLYPTAEKKRVEIGPLRETMNINSQKIGRISPNQPSRFCSVVGSELPFVGSTSPTLATLVGKKMPSVVNWSQFGFTLIELMVTLVIAAILVSYAVPNMRTFIQNGRLSTQANDFVSDITYARSEAIKRGTNVVICPSTTGAACLASGSSWQNGRLMFVDGDGNSTWSGAPPDTQLRFREGLGGTNTLQDATLPITIVFDRRGALTGAVGFTFNLCDERGVTHGRSITLNSTGQVRVLPSTTPPASCP